MRNTPGTKETQACEQEMKQLLDTQIPFGAANVGESKGGVWVPEIWSGKVQLKSYPLVHYTPRKWSVTP